MVSSMAVRAPRRPEPTRWLRAAGVVVAMLLLASCGHSRIVRRDYDRAGRVESSRPARGPSSGAIEPLPRDGVHVVRRGETLYGISFRFGLRYQDVAAWNGIADPYVIEIGQRLRLQPGAGDWRTTGSASPPLRAAGARPPTRSVAATPASPRGSRPPMAATPSPAMPVQASSPSPVGAGAMSWRWPARGQVIGHYVAGDQLQQGINIAGTAGQPVQAAGDGVVVYSGAGLVGYGELIIIKHNDEWLSAYAHNRRRLVNEGARVHAGDTIAEMGHTGASRDMLHFEIRRNGKPVDPLVFLPAP
jgi:lipoprotein NlpD